MSDSSPRSPVAGLFVVDSPSDILDTRWDTHVEIFGHIEGYSRGDVGHTNGDMGKFLDMF